MKYFLSVIIVPLLMLVACAQAQSGKNPYYSQTDTQKLNVSNAEWKKILPAGVYNIAREKGTERAFTGQYVDNHQTGTYHCRVCGNPLYSSAAKFESGTGWPSFYQPLKKTAVVEETDSDGSRTEVLCARCGSHMGHVFNDGPNPTGLRYCMNGNVLNFVAKK